MCIVLEGTNCGCGWQGIVPNKAETMARTCRAVQLQRLCEHAAVTCTLSISGREEIRDNSIFAARAPAGTRPLFGALACAIVFQLLARPQLFQSSVACAGSPAQSLSFVSRLPGRIHRLVSTALGLPGSTQLFSSVVFATRAVCWGRTCPLYLRFICRLRFGFGIRFYWLQSFWSADSGGVASSGLL